MHMVANPLKLQLKKLDKLSKVGLCLLLLISAAGCASTPAIQSDDSLIASILNYEALLPENHPDSINHVYSLPESVRKSIRERFTRRDRHRNASDLAQWLMDPDGYNMVYDLDANLTPVDAFYQRRGNCLSFTLLLVELASELGINLKVNQVDLPDTWGQNSQRDLIFYRHVNAIFKSTRSTQIFDLAMEEYKPGFPQRLISRREGVALLFSNIGIEKLKDGDSKAAIHYLRLSTSIFPDNPDMWINLGAAYKHIGKLDVAEKVYLQAFGISDKNSLAASNLERLYRHQGQKALAKRFEKLAARARTRNPYAHFQNAEVAYKNKQYHRASKLIKRAIKLHKDDPDFYELSSLIKQANNKHLSAIKDLEKAHSLSTSIEERGRYVKKVKMVIAKVKQLQEQRANNRVRTSPNRSIKINGINYP